MHRHLTPGRLLAALAVLAALALAGCGGTGPGTNYAIHLDAYAEKVDFGKRFVVLQGVMENPPKDADFAKAADSLATALEARGYKRVGKVDEADLGVYLAYRVTEEHRSPFENFDEGPAGRSPRSLLFIDFTRDVLVEAVDLARYKANNPKNMVWKIRLVSKGPTGDIQKIMPYVAAAVAQYMGQSTEAYVVVDDALKVHPYNPDKRGRRPQP